MRLLPLRESIDLTKFLALGLSVLLACGCSQARESAPATSIALGSVSHNMDVADVALAPGAASACVAGSYIVDADAVVHSAVMLVDIAQKKLGWVAHIKPPAGAANLTAAACRIHGNNLYVLANADSSSARTTSQSSVHLYKYALSGELLKHAPLPVAASNAVGIALVELGGKLQVVGYTKDVDEKNEYYAMLLSNFDEGMAFQTKVLKTGAYNEQAAVRALGGNLYMGGEFYMKTASRTDLASYYASSRVTPAGASQWSVRPQHQLVTRSENIATAIGDDGSAYSLSHSKGNTSLIVVDPAGKAGAAKTYKSTYCAINSLAATAKGLFAIRRQCDRAKGKDALVWIDPVAGAEKTVKLLAQKPKFIGAADGRWYGVGGSADKLEFSIGTPGGQ